MIEDDNDAKYLTELSEIFDSKLADFHELKRIAKKLKRSRPGVVEADLLEFIANLLGKNKELNAQKDIMTIVKMLRDAKSQDQKDLAKRSPSTRWARSF